MDIFIYINVFIAGWVSCQLYLAWKIRQAMKKVAQENGMSFEELIETFFESKTKVIKVPKYFTETSGSSILLYCKDTGDFISQASSMEELADNVYKFNKIKLAAVNHENNFMWFIEGKVEKEKIQSNES